MANLKVTIREELTLNGYDQGAKNTLTISDVDEVFKRIVTCPANNETTVARFRSSVGNASGTATFDSALDVQNSDSIPETPELYLLQLFQPRQTLQSRSGSLSERLDLDSGLLWGQEIDICLVFLSNVYFLSEN